MMMPRSFILLVVACGCAGAKPAYYLAKPAEWFGSGEGKTITARVLSWQTPRGDWPKNHDSTQDAHEGDGAKLTGTFDNGATTDELRYLAAAYRATRDVACRDAFLAGMDHVLEAQYPNGGWPQCDPAKGYQTHITFNDGTMVRLMELLREVNGSDDYKFVEEGRRKMAGTAVEKGIACILKCQVMIGGVPTVWCAQHDEVTFAPAKARAYELPSLSGSESGGILKFLMSVTDPSPEVVRAVNGGAAWFEKVKIHGIRIETVNGDKKVVEDAAAPPVWARFYDLETGLPFFCGRDGVKKDALSSIDAERRDGYAWYGNWGEAVAKARAKWPHG